MPRPQSDTRTSSRTWLTVRWTRAHQERSHLVRTWQAFHLDHLPGDPEVRARQLVAALDGAIRSAALRRQAIGKPREELFAWQAGTGYRVPPAVAPALPAPVTPPASCQS